VITALMSGELDVVANAGSAMRVASPGAPVKAIFFPFYKSTFVFVSAPEIKKVADLKGKIVGVSAAGNNTEIAATMVLQQNGVNPDRDVTFLAVGGGDTSVASLQAGLLQAMTVNPDMAFLMKKSGLSELVLLADMAPWPWGGFASSDAKLTQERDKVKRWTRGMVKAMLFMLNKKEETIRIAMQEFGYPRDVTEAALAVSVKAIDPKNIGGADEETLRQNFDLTIAQPLKIKEPLPIAKLVDFSVLRAAQKELGLFAGSK